MEDQEIISLYYTKGSKEKAFQALVDKYKERLYWHIRKMVIIHEDADDLLQDIFLKIWYGLENFRNDSKLYTWMFRIATNECITFLNEKKRKVYGNTEEMTEALCNHLETDLWFDGDAIQKELQKAILHLSERQRMIFNMRYYDEMSYNEMAEIMDIAVGTLKSTYHNAVKKIEEQLNLSENIFN